MRTGTVQQTLTQEAASVLKQSLILAKRRGHAQVTPLHVATTLLTFSKDSTNLLRRACLKSHPFHCRALELCFNVALNRLPSIPPPSPNSLIPSRQPSLSNSLIAALKRAQAQQRRSSIELQQQQQQHLQEQPLVAIKVELEQLIISILDDPSVSRVMREAGFSSSCVKANIEEVCSASLYGELFSCSHFFRNQCLKTSSQEEDLKVVVEVMLRKQNRRCNTVLVGDSLSKAESLVAELMQRVRRGEVPDDLKPLQFIKLQVSSSQLKIMSRNEVEMMVFELERKVGSLVRDVGVIVYAGDLRWVVDEEDEEVYHGYNPLDHFVNEIGRLMEEMRSCNKVFLMGIASYKTYMKCQRRQPPLDAQWNFQVVVVPSGGLALSLQASSGMDSKEAAKVAQSHLQMIELKPFRPTEENGRLLCCAECTSNYERDVSVLKLRSLAETKNIDPWNPDKVTLLEIRRKWSEWCQTNHHLYPSFVNQNMVDKKHAYASYHPWWSSSFPINHNNAFLGSHPVSFAELFEKDVSLHSNYTSPLQSGIGEPHERNELKKSSNPVSLYSLQILEDKEVTTTLALASSLLSDSATSKDQAQELHRGLLENIPWQSECIPSIVEALLDSISSKKGTSLLIQGTDWISKRRVAKTIAEFLYETEENLIHMNMKKSPYNDNHCGEKLFETLKRNPKRVVFVEGIDQAHSDFIKMLLEKLKIFRDTTIFIFGTSSEQENANKNFDQVLKMTMRIEETSIDASPTEDHKRKSYCHSPPTNSKKPRVEKTKIDLNIEPKEEGEGLRLPQELLETVGSCFTLNVRQDHTCKVFEDIFSKLQRAFEAAQSGREEKGQLSVDPTALDELMEASSFILESLFEEWLKEVFHKSLLEFKKSGKVRLSVEGRGGHVVEHGFKDSVLPNRIHVDLD